MNKFMRDYNSNRVPLLGENETVLVRVEAKYFGRDQLDLFVFHLAQEVGFTVEWFERRCRNSALSELEECGIANEGLRPYSLSTPRRYTRRGWSIHLL